MTPRENLLAAFRHQEPEWVPWVPLTGGANTPAFVPEAVKRDPSRLKLPLYLNEELGCDVLFGRSILQQRYQTAKVTRETKGDYTSVTYEVAGRTLKSVTRALPFGEETSDHISEYPIKKPQDIETLGYLVKDSYRELSTKEFEVLDNELGDRGIINVYGPTTPIMQFILDLMALEEFIYALSDYPKELHAVMEQIDDKNAEAYVLLTQANVAWEAVWSCEDSSSLLISPDMFKRYALPSLSRYAKICRDADKIYMVHTCGHIREFLQMFLETGIGALHYLAGPPTGNTPLREARDLWKDDITIMAAVEPVLLMRATPDEVREHILEMLKTAQPGRSFMLMSSSKPDVPETNLRTVAHTMKESGAYPLAAT